MAQYNGSRSWIELKPEQEWDFLQGWRNTRKFTGMYSALADLATNIQANETNAVDIKLSQPNEEGWAHLDVVYTIEQNVTWQFTRNVIEASIWNNDKLAGLFASEYEKRIVHSAIDKIVEYMYNYYLIATIIDNDYNNYYYNGNPLLFGNYSTTDKTLFDAFRTWYKAASLASQNIIDAWFNMSNNGVTSYPLGQMVLRKVVITDTANPTAYSTGQLFPGQCNYVFSTAKLLEHFNTENQMPSYMVTLLNNVWPTVKWLYHSFSIEEMQNARLTITQDWWMCTEYEKALYTEYTL